jgi:hypothetical protein
MFLWKLPMGYLLASIFDRLAESDSLKHRVARKQESSKKAESNRKDEIFMRWLSPITKTFQFKHSRLLSVRLASTSCLLVHENPWSRNYPQGR